MTPDKQQELLKRCLALQPLVGWPEWAGDPVSTQAWRVDWQYSLKPGAVGSWWVHEIRQDKRDRIICELRRHSALCIWQDHLLGWLAGQERILTIQHNVPFKQPWSAHITGCDCEIAFGDTLIEALLDVCEQIQKEVDDA